MRDLTNLKTYIIDSDNPHEVDDAISLEITDLNVKKLWVHISNPCNLFNIGSSIDLEARKKISSLYLTDQYIPMLPKEVISEANLKQNKVSKTISVSIDFNKNGSINNYEIVEAIINPKYQLTYEDVNEIIELEPKEEKEIIELKKLLLKSFDYRKCNGAVSIDLPTCKIKLKKGKIIIIKEYKSIAHIMVSEAMILMGYVAGLFLDNMNLPGAYRSQRINCNPEEILNKYNNSEIKYIILKQYMGKSYISNKPNRHDSLGLSMYVQCTSPLRRYLDLIIQRQIYNKITDKELISTDFISEIIEHSKIKQSENNNIYKIDRNKYFSLFFKENNKSSYKIIFVKWINYKKNLALVYFSEYNLETIITFYTSIDVYLNKVYKVKYHKNDCNYLEFIY